MKNCVFKAFVSNLGLYNEGVLEGEWMNFPTTSDELHKVYQRIGIGKDYEEVFISDYSSI